MGRGEDMTDNIKMEQDVSVEDTLRLALEALKKLVFLAEHEGWEGFDKQYEAITLIEQALEKRK